MLDLSEKSSKFRQVTSNKTWLHNHFLEGDLEEIQKHVTSESCEEENIWIVKEGVHISYKFRASSELVQTPFNCVDNELLSLWQSPACRHAVEESKSPINAQKFSRWVFVDFTQKLFFKHIENIISDNADKEYFPVMVQKYIEKPLLIHKRKFDIRQWFMLHRTDENLNIYIYDGSYLR